MLALTCRSIAAVASLHLVLFAAPLRAQELAAPAFRDAPLAKVTCRPGKPRPSPIGTSILQVEVSNRTEWSCEPTLFHCEWKDPGGAARSLDVARVPLPRVRRVGRLVPSQKSSTFWIQLPVSDLKGLEVRVAEALFSDAPGLDRSPVEAGRIEYGERQRDAQRVACSSVALENRLPHVVDVVLRAHFSAPKDADALLTATVPANGDGRVDFLVLPVALEWTEPLNYYAGAHLESVEVVDWSARLASDPAAAHALINDSYGHWLRCGTPGTAFVGRFRAESESRIGDRSMSAEGTFAVDIEGNVATHAAMPSSAALAKERLEQMLAGLKRPTLEQLLADNEFEIVAPGMVAIRGPGWTGFRADATLASPFVPRAGTATPPQVDWPVFGLDASGRLATSGSITRPVSRRLRTRPMGEGFVVVEERSPEGTDVTEHAFQEIGGIALPALVRHTMYDAGGKVVLRDECRLFDLALDPRVEVAALAAPSGPGVDGLRAAWERVYRYPDAPFDLAAQFSVGNPGTDLTWLGLRKVDGSLLLKGFRGFRWSGAAWSSSSVTIAGKVAADSSTALGFALLDRIVMWTGRDPSSMGSFDEFFRGCVIAVADSGDVYLPSTGPVAEVRVADGLIHSLRLRSGIERRFTWKEAGERRIATRIESGEEVVSAKWREVRKDLWLPVDIEFQRVFGRDWGPETLRFTNVRATE